MSTDTIKTPDQLRLLIKRAKNNATRQRTKELLARYVPGVQVRVRSEFWEQAARDYQKELEEIEE